MDRLSGGAKQNNPSETRNLKKHPNRELLQGLPLDGYTFMRLFWRRVAAEVERPGLTLPAAILVTLLFLPTTGLPAQETAATVRGRVQTPMGAPIPETTVTAKNLETGQNYTVTSDTEGQFEILQLATGSYEVQVSRPGFASQTQKGLQLRAGQPVSLDFVLERGPGSQERMAQATGEGTAEPSSTATTNRISESQLAGLPLNGRSYSQLATLQSGISDPFGGSAQRGGGSGGLTVAGGRSTSNVFLLDGTNIMNVENRVPRSAAGGQLGSDAVFQVQIFSSNYAAEYGRGSGGILNSITRSGTPEFHGTFFEFFRNSRLDARNFFDPGPEPTPFKRNQFGFTLTGPVVKDRTFFMGSFEGLRDRLAKTEIDFFPDELARQGIITDKAGKQIRTVPVAPSVKPYLALYPLPNSVPLGGGVGVNAAPQFLPSDESYFTVRVDHQVSDRNSLFARYTFDDASSRSGSPSVVFSTLTNSRQQYLTLVDTHIFNPRLLNSLRLGYTRPVDASESLSSIEIPRSLFFLPDAPQFGWIDVPGMTAFGPFFVQPDMNIMNTFQFADDMVVQRGAHALKFGFEVHRYRWDMVSNFLTSGQWSFNSLDSFLQAGPSGTTLQVALPGSDNRRNYRQTLAGFYVQDAYTVNPHLQLNLGLRYEFATVISDKFGKTVFLRDPVRDSAIEVGRLLENNPSLRNISPRLGIRWSPGSSGNTVLSGGFGIYYDELLEHVVDRQKSTAPFSQIAVKPNFDSSGTFPDAVAAGTGTPLLAQSLDRNTTTPMVLRYNFTLQQQLPGDWRARASYVGARGNHLFRGYEANLFPVPITRDDGSLFFSPNSGPVNPAFGGINIVSSDAQSFYNSLQLSANKSLSQGISLQASYTYSKSVDDASVPFSDSGSGQYGLLRALDRSLSNFDIRHRLVLNYFYTLPLGSGQQWWNSGVLSHIFGGWRLGGILSFRTGIPFIPLTKVRTPGFLFAANRPDLLSGRSNNPIKGVTAGCGFDPITGKFVVEPGRELGTPELYFDPCVYKVPEEGTLGNAGRNTLIAPNVFNVDVSLQREFSLDAKRRLQFRAEFFNLPNHTSFDRIIGGSNLIFSGASGRLNPSAGRLHGTATTARQIQFALRFSF